MLTEVYGPDKGNFYWFLVCAHLRGGCRIHLNFHGSEEVITR